MRDLFKNEIAELYKKTLSLFLFVGHVTCSCERRIGREFIVQVTELSE